MEVTPPSTLRRLGIALAGLAVAALTGAACVLSFDDLRSLAVRGEGRPDLAFLYPAAFDALLVVALISVLLVRSARTLVRVQAALVLVLLIVAAAAVDVLAALRYDFPIPPTAVGVAVAPWVMLAVALVAVVAADQACAGPQILPDQRRRYGSARHRAVRRGRTHRDGATARRAPRGSAAARHAGRRRAAAQEGDSAGIDPGRGPDGRAGDPAHLGAGHPLAHGSRARTGPAPRPPGRLGIGTRTRARRARPARRHCGSGIEVRHPAQRPARGRADAGEAGKAREGREARSPSPPPPPKPRPEPRGRSGPETESAARARARGRGRGRGRAAAQVTAPGSLG